MSFNFKKITNKLPLLAIAVPFLILLLSFSTTVDNNKLNKNAYTGQQIFSAIYLNENTLGGELNTYQKVRGNFNVSAKNLKWNASVVKEIEKDFPGFFTTFKANITSGDHLKIKQQIEEGQRKLLDATSKLGSTGMATSIQQVPTQQPPAPVFIVIQNIYTNVAVAAVILPLGPPSLPLSNAEAAALNNLQTNDLFGELLVDELVQKFI